MKTTSTISVSIAVSLSPLRGFTLANFLIAIYGGYYLELNSLFWKYDKYDIF